jgi:hypothetical protein
MAYDGMMQIKGGFMRQKGKWEEAETGERP